MGVPSNSTKLKCAAALGLTVGASAVLLAINQPTAAILVGIVGCTVSVLLALVDLPSKLLEQQRREMFAWEAGSLGDRIDRAGKSTTVNVQTALALRERFSGIHMPISTFSMMPPNLAAVIDLLDTCQPETIVELGSGISTLYIASWLKTRGTGRLITFDHDAEWAELCRSHLRRLDLAGRAEIRVAPLCQRQSLGETVNWYDLDAAASDIQRVDLLIVDGPPAGSKDSNLSRLPAMEAFKAKLGPSAVVFLDDGNRPGERAVAQTWTKHYPEFAAAYFNTVTGYWIVRRGRGPGVSV